MFLSDTGSIRTLTNSGSRLDSYFGRFLDDLISMWPGPHRIGLQLLQVGVSMQIDDITEPYVLKSLSLRFNGHCPDEPGLPGVY